jgi:hypothetical protein
MIINDFDRGRVGALPDEANAPLVVDANTVLGCSATLKGFQPIARRHPKVIQFSGGMELNEFTESGALDVWRKSPGTLALPNLFRLFTGERLNHDANL